MWYFVEMISKYLQKLDSEKLSDSYHTNLEYTQIMRGNLFSWLMQLILSVALIHPVMQLPSVMASKCMSVCHFSLHSVS